MIEKTLKLFCLFSLVFLAKSVSAAIVPDAPTLTSAIGGHGQALLIWSPPSYAGDSVITDYVLEYKASSSGTWLTFADGTSTLASYSISGLTDGTPYDFRVSATNTTGTGSPSSVLSATPVATYFNHIVSTGQSLSVGTAGLPKITITQPYNNKSINLANTALNVLVEAINNARSPSVETMSSAMANSLTKFSAEEGVVNNYLVTLHGKDATAYSGLKKSTTQYNLGMTHVTSGKTLVEASGRQHRVQAITAVHGETDQINNVSAATYAGYLVEWQNDLQTDIWAITGQTGILPFFTDQATSWSLYNKAAPTVALGQWVAARDNPTKIFLVLPKYILDYADGVHLTNYSYRRLGEYYAKVMKKVLVDGESWLPVSPREIRMSGNIIIARFNVPVPPLVFDTSIVLAKTNYGFVYSDSTSSASITNEAGMSIIAPDTVRITLSGTPTGASPKLRYAYTSTLGSGAGRSVAGAPRGNLRDSDTTEALYQDSLVPVSMGNYLYNWSVVFDEAITVDNTTPTISAGAPTTAQPAGTTSVALQVTTNENATCKYDTTSGVAYASMSGTFSTTGTTAHSQTISGLTNNTSYTYYVRCTDDLNTNSSDYSISFSVDQGDIIPPVLSLGSPTTAQSAGTTSVSLEVATDENATCRYGTTAGVAYASIASTFSTTGSTAHSQTISGLTDNTSYSYYVRCIDSSSNATTSDYTISFSVDQGDVTAPILSAGAPTTAQPAGTTSVALQVTTNENATCKYDTTSGVAYASMSGTFSTTGTTAHSQTISGLTNNTSYTYYVRCTDSFNVNSSDYEINFSVEQVQSIPISSGSRASKRYLEYRSTGVKSDVLSVNSENKECPVEYRLTQDLRTGAKNGIYEKYTGSVVTDAKILQYHLNRLGFNSGVEDGILGPISDGAIKRMQIYLGTKADGYVGPITRALINSSCS